MWFPASLHSLEMSCQVKHKNRLLRHLILPDLLPPIWSSLIFVSHTLKAYLNGITCVVMNEWSVMLTLPHSPLDYETPLLKQLQETFSITSAHMLCESQLCLRDDLMLIFPSWIEYSLHFQHQLFRAILNKTLPHLWCSYCKVHKEIQYKGRGEAKRKKKWMQIEYSL